MKTIRSLASTRSSMHRVLLTFTAAFVLIAGLLAMHTLSTGDAHIESGVTAAAGHDQLASSATMDSAAVEDGHCPGDCGTPGNMPGHSMLLMVCALALLAAVIIVLAPALLTRLSTTLGMTVLVRDVARALPRPRPPSLLVLSISRT